ncbi:SMC family ATPase [Georgenia sp. M64]|uniref:SMC family ATPase n=1 Tax=Georgenia sp. M64 TaxID=3120520 RepID=UPI0030E309A1
MRIHRLVLEAVGPFPGRHEIDFDALATSGLFLLEGPTGAGKSTVIDAVVFALYGKVAGAEASDDRLHSDFAGPEAEPSVELTFSTAAGIFRIWRSPTFRRPKKRGGGFTQQNARARLWRLAAVGDEGEPVSAHVQEVGTELSRIVVLDRAQFTQTVVLPQGQFASFLRARPEDRRTVLQDVFGTEIYERLQRTLAEMARDTRAAVERARAEVTGSARSFAEAAQRLTAAGQEAGAGRDDAAVQDEAARQDGAAVQDDAAVQDESTRRVLDAAAAMDHRALCRITAETRSAARRVVDAAAALREETRVAEERARTRLHAEEQLADLVERRRILLAEQETLAARDGAVAAEVARLDLARRAASVAPVLVLLDRARRSLVEADETCERLDLGPDADLASLDDVDDLRAAHDAATAELGSLSALVTLEDGLAARGTGLSAARAQHEADTVAYALAQNLLDERPAARELLVETMSAFRDAGAAHAEAQAAATNARARVNAATEAAHRSRDLAAAEVEMADRAAAAVRAADAEHAARRRWVAGMAGALAGELVPDAACPVCGSVEHPAPAELSPEHATEDEVAAATAVREAADEVLVRARTRVAGLREQLAGLHHLAGGLDVAAARAALEDAERAVADAKAAIYRSAELDQELADHDAETARLTAELGRAQSALAVETERLEQLAARLREDQARCALACGPAGSVAERARALERRATTALALLDAILERRSATLARDDALAQLERALSETGLRDAETAHRGALPPDERTRLEQSVRRHESAVERVTAELAEPAVSSLAGDEQPDVEAAAAAHAAAMADLTDAAAAAREAELTATHVTDAAHRLETDLAAHTRDVEQAAPLLRAAALTNATDMTDMTLATYVLVRRFEDVVAAANDRLAEMSDGRYSLERIDEREGGQRSRRAGLGLQVQDHVTETPRDPRTLSGGETFYVSLCLALGLADVVRAEAGGVELGTLFVDEGFGSLDPATLDAVMAELGRLREGGRAVGIVSHVAELKDRIPERIEVRRTRDGASTLRVRC